MVGSSSITTIVCSRATGSCWHGGVQWRRVTTYLDRILEVHRESAALDPRPLAALERAAALQPETRGFRKALERHAAGGRLAVVAEIKRRSPSKGELSADLDPGAAARPAFRC